MGIDRQRQEVLLKEYEVCQQDETAVGARAWQATAVLLPVVAGGLAYASWSDKIQNAVTNWDLVILACFYISVIVSWMVIVYRQVRQQRIAYFRMQEIEWDLGMRKNLYAHWLDHWSNREQPSGTLEELHRELPGMRWDWMRIWRWRWRWRWGRGYAAMMRIGLFAIVGWLAILALELAKFGSVKPMAVA
jgi:hypothetical protein